MISREIENAGIPTALITSLVPTALMVGARRVVPALAITHPLGNPELPAPQEREVRRTILLKALKAVQDRAL